VGVYLRVSLHTRGVTRLDGARDKKQVWNPHVRNRPFGSEYIVLKKVAYSWHCWDFSAPPQPFSAPQWFGALIVTRRPGNRAPLPPLVTPLLPTVSNTAVCRVKELLREQLKWWMGPALLVANNVFLLLKFQQTYPFQAKSIFSDRLPKCL